MRRTRLTRAPGRARRPSPRTRPTSRGRDAPPGRAGSGAPETTNRGEPSRAARCPAVGGTSSPPRTRTHRTASSAPAAPSVWPTAPFRPCTGTDPALGPRTCASAASSIASLKTVPGSVGAHEVHVGGGAPGVPERGLRRAGETGAARIGARHVERVGRRAVARDARENAAPRRRAASSSSRRRNPAPSPSVRPSRAASNGRATVGLRARSASKPENTNAESASAPPARTRVARPSRIHPAARPIAAVPDAHAVETVATGPRAAWRRARRAASAPGDDAARGGAPDVEASPPGLAARERRPDGHAGVRAAECPRRRAPRPPRRARAASARSSVSPPGSSGTRGTSAAARATKRLVSKSETGAIALRPLHAPSRNAATPGPKALTAPIPVTATRRPAPTSSL